MVMIARGAMGDPWIFEQSLALLQGKDLPKRPPVAERAKTAMQQFEMAAQHKGEKVACLEARKHYAWYLNGVPHSSYFKTQISKAQTLNDLRKITDGIIREL